jgi:hypothetical protein
MIVGRYRHENAGPPGRSPEPGRAKMRAPPFWLLREANSRRLIMRRDMETRLRITGGFEVMGFHGLGKPEERVGELEDLERNNRWGFANF